MRIKEGFVLREICGQTVVSGEGLEQVNFSKLVTLNPTAKYLWEKAIEDGLFTVESLAKALCQQFPNVPSDTILSDCNNLVKQWIDNGLIDQ